MDYWDNEFDYLKYQYNYIENDTKKDMIEETCENSYELGEYYKNTLFKQYDYDNIIRYYSIYKKEGKIAMIETIKRDNLEKRLDKKRQKKLQKKLAKKNKS